MPKRLLNKCALLLVLALFAACSESPVLSSGGPPRDAAGDGEELDQAVDLGLEPTDDDLDGDGLPNDLEDLNLNGQYDQGTLETDPFNPDSDGDGLLDGAEDANQNGQVDPGETDPRTSDTDGDGLTDSDELAIYDTDPTLADTDGDAIGDGDELANGTDPNNPDSDSDGLQDGEEDRDGDGVLDDGETDPLQGDTDGDGVLDSSEPLQIACARSRQASVSILEHEEGGFALALPQYIDETGTYALRGAGATVLAGAYFQDADGALFGFAVAKSPEPGSDTAVASGEAEASAMRGLGAVSSRMLSPVRTGGQDTAVWGSMQVRLDRDLVAADVRDEIAAAVARRPLSELGPRTGAGGPTASDWALSYGVRVWADRVVVVGVVAPVTALSDDERTAPRMQSLSDGSIVGRSGAALDQVCTPLVPRGADQPIDYLWVVDKTADTAGVRGAIADLSDTLFSALEAAGVDFRIGVAGTGMHTGDDWVLVRPGFSTLPADFVDQMGNPPGTVAANGLGTGTNVVRLARNPGMTSGGAAARPEADVVVVFVSDKMDGSIALQISQNVPGCNPAVDPMLPDCARLSDHANAYRGANLTAYALVGDLPDGCAPLEPGGPGATADEPGQGYVQVAYATAGAFYSLCGPDLRDPIRRLARASAGSAGAHLLETPPVSHSLRVVDGDVVLVSSATNGFELDPASGSLLFTGDARPAAGAEVFVSYWAWTE